MLNLAEAAKLSDDILVQGVIEEIIKESPCMERLPFIEVVGSAYKYNRENTLPGIDFYDAEEDWVESTPTYTPKTASLVIMGGDADVPRFYAKTYSNVNDLEGEVMSSKAKALRHKFEDTFLYGDSAVNPKAFDGLRKIIDLTTPGSQVICPGGATGGALTLEHMDELQDKVKGGPPDAFIMSRRSRRSLNKLVRAAGSPHLDAHVNDFGVWMEYWNKIPIWINDWQLDTHAVSSSKETGITASNNSVIYAVRLGADALHGICSPEHIWVESLGTLEKKSATRTRIGFYCSLVLKCTLAAAAMIGVQPAA